MSNVRYLYIQDPRCEDRVLTVARQLREHCLAVTWCVNRVSVYEHKKHDKENKIWFKYRDVAIYDPFNKALARTICAGRLSIGRAILVDLPEERNTRSYLTAIIVALCTHQRDWEWENPKYATNPPSLPRVDRIVYAAYSHDQRRITE